MRPDTHSYSSHIEIIQQMQQLSIVSHEIRDISIRSIPWITFCSTKYKKNHTVVLCRIVSQPFAFGMVKAIYGHLEEYVLFV